MSGELRSDTVHDVSRKQVIKQALSDELVKTNFANASPDSNSIVEAGYDLFVSDIVERLGGTESEAAEVFLRLGIRRNENLRHPEIDYGVANVEQLVQQANIEWADYYASDPKIERMALKVVLDHSDESEQRFLADVMGRLDELGSYDVPFELVAEQALSTIRQRQFETQQRRLDND